MKATVLSGSYLSTAKYNADPKKPISSPWVRGAVEAELIGMWLDAIVLTKALPQPCEDTNYGGEKKNLEDDS